jgi:ribonuclease Z
MTRAVLVCACVLAIALPKVASAQRASTGSGDALRGDPGRHFRRADVWRTGIGVSTLVIGGAERLLFDAGRSTTTGMVRVGINPADVQKVFLTHLHSDHIISLPELLLFPWASQGRAVPLQVWGPAGTNAMMQHLAEAFAFDIHIRPDVDEHYPASGVEAVATDIPEGVVYDTNGIKVTAFLVDHGPVAPAFGYRVDYAGHSVVISGDTRPSENVVKAATGADVLIHEVGRWKQDPTLAGPPDELVRGTRQSRSQMRTIADHHTDAVEGGASSSVPIRRWRSFHTSPRTQRCCRWSGRTTPVGWSWARTR